MKKKYVVLFGLLLSMSMFVYANDEAEGETDETIAATRVAVYSDFGAPSVIAQQADCQNKNKTQILQFPTTIPQFNFNKDLTSKIVHALNENDYDAFWVAHAKDASEKNADYLLSIVANNQPFSWDKEQMATGGYGIYSKALTKGYVGYQLVLEDLHAHKKIALEVHFLSTALPDSKLLPKYAKCPIVAVDMPREDLVAMHRWLAKDVVANIQGKALKILETSEPQQ